MEFSHLKANLKKDHSGLPAVTVAVLGDSSTQLMCQALAGAGYEAGLALRVFDAGVDQINQQVLTADSELYQFDPDHVLLFHSAQKLLDRFYKASSADKYTFSKDYLQCVQSLWDALIVQRQRQVTHCNLVEINDGVFGHFANKVELSFLYHVRRINYELMNMARRSGNVFILDVCSLHAYEGERTAFSSQLYVNAGMVFSLDFLPAVAESATAIIASSLGMAHKCLVLDLDNTLWGGVIGDDGIENIELGDLGGGKAFSELQLWIRQLKERGIVLAVCSKNDEATAREPFEKHPDMVLRLEDFAVFMANWNSKPDNILQIQKTLNIGLDAMVFLDDNPVERDMVRKALPAVTVPELPLDPAEYLTFLRSQNLFEMASYSDEDASRTKMYRQEAERKTAQQEFSSQGEFLASLQMQGSIVPFDSFNAPRVAQLTQRSNQFNLRTVRYAQGDIERMINDEQCRGFAIGLKDKFGDEGLVSAIVLRRQGEDFFVDTWVMSCRVVSRGLERFALNFLVKAASDAGATQLVGEFLPTTKNSLVRDHYAALGFHEAQGRWVLQITDYQNLLSYISEVRA
jgi:FkbH-like protein